MTNRDLAADDAGSDPRESRVSDSAPYIELTSRFPALRADERLEQANGIWRGWWHSLLRLGRHRPANGKLETAEEKLAWYTNGLIDRIDDLFRPTIEMLAL